MNNLHGLSLSYLYGLLREAKRSLGRAEYRPNAPPEELAALQQRINILDYIIPIILNAEENDE